MAVLPFKYTGDNRDLKALAEGLTEEIIDRTFALLVSPRDRARIDREIFATNPATCAPSAKNLERAM